MHRQNSSGPVDPSFRALSGRLNSMVRWHKFKQGSLASVSARATFTGVRHSPEKGTPLRCAPAKAVTSVGARATFLLLLLDSRTGPRRALSLKLSDTRVYEPPLRYHGPSADLLCPGVCVRHEPPGPNSYARLRIPFSRLPRYSVQGGLM